MEQTRMSVSWLTLTVFVLGVGLMAICKADPIPPPHQSAEQRQMDSLNADIEEDKRAWQNLHGGWGKRGWSDMNTGWGKRAWQNLHGGWGKRGWNDMSSAWGKRAWKDMGAAWGKRGWKDMSSAWGKRAWDNLHGGWGKRQWEKLNMGWGKRDMDDRMDFYDGSNSPVFNSDMYDSNTYDQQYPILDQMLYNEARLMNEADEQLAKKYVKSLLRNTTGQIDKREPGWNNLKGLWGKRNVMDYVDDSQSDMQDKRED